MLSSKEESILRTVEAAPTDEEFPEKFQEEPAVQQRHVILSHLQVSVQHRMHM